MTDCCLDSCEALMVLARAMGCRPDSPLARAEKLDLGENLLFTTSAREDSVGFAEAWAAAAVAGKDGWASHLTHLGMCVHASMPVPDAWRARQGLCNGRTIDSFVRAMGELGVFPRLRDVRARGGKSYKTAWQEVEQVFVAGVEAGVRAERMLVRKHRGWYEQKERVVPSIGTTAIHREGW